MSGGAFDGGSGITGDRDPGCPPVVRSHTVKCANMERSILQIYDIMKKSSINPKKKVDIFWRKEYENHNF